MVKYQNGKIYTIRCRSDDTLIYVGSTTRALSQRMTEHRSNCKLGKCVSLYDYIVNDDWGDWYIELYEVYPCNSKEELLKKEGDIIRQIGTINKCIAGRTRKEWCEDNAEYKKEYNKKYREENAEKYKKYREENAEYIKEKHKKYYEDNADKINEKNKKYREDNADKIKEYKKTYYEDNADKIKEKVCCNICGAFSSKHQISRHQKSKKCMSKSLDNTDIPTDTHI